MDAYLIVGTVAFVAVGLVLVFGIAYLAAPYSSMRHTRVLGQMADNFVRWLTKR